MDSPPGIELFGLFGQEKLNNHVDLRYKEFAIINQLTIISSS